MNAEQRAEWDTMLLSPLPRPKQIKAKKGEGKVDISRPVQNIVGDEDGSWAALLGRKKG
jgi:hypothetical protein